jgi:hypothetical protein
MASGQPSAPVDRSKSPGQGSDIATAREKTDAGVGTSSPTTPEEIVAGGSGTANGGAASSSPAQVESGSGQLPPASEKDANDDGGGSVWVVLGFVVVFALFVLWSDDTTRSWILKYRTWIIDGVLLVVLAALATLTVIWLRKGNSKARAAALVLGGYPLLAFALGGLTFWLPPRWQLVAIRAVILVVLVTFPAAMWWLFLASQRASLLNEYLSNLDRLGLLTTRRVGSYTETNEATAVRIRSYAQKFEATYGRIPEEIHAEIQDRSYRPYRDEEVREQTPLATAAVPVSMVVIVLAIGWLLTLPPIPDFPSIESQPRWLLALTPNLSPATVAFLGAYFYSLQMLFRRYVRSDLRGSAYVAVLIRTVLALIGVWVLASILPAALNLADWQMLVIAFVVGVFPLVAWQVIRSLAAKLFKFTLPTLEPTLGLSHLDGLTVWHESRLEEEDIENVANMATADIVDLMVNTRIPAGRIVDWVDQAILLTQLGVTGKKDDQGDESRLILLGYGIRTASSLIEVCGEFDRQPPAGGAKFLSILDTPDRLRSLVVAVRSNNNLPLILTWRGVEPPVEPASKTAGAEARSSASLTTSN